MALVEKPWRPLDRPDISRAHGLTAQPSARDKPEIGQAGDYALGTRAFELVLADRPVLTPESFGDGVLPLQARSLGLRTWYPARSATGQAALYEHQLALPGHPAVLLASAGSAVPDAPPLDSESFPVVVLSHGFGGWNTQFSRLAEHIASRGYVVVSIDHRDRPPASMADFLVSFGNVLIDRPLDQRAVMSELAAMAAPGDGRLPRCADPSTVALIGYSMGGYGALTTAGASLALACPPFDQLPPHARGILEAIESGPNIDALVLFAPWGGQQQSRAWNAQALCQVQMPALIVSGSEDDVVDHTNGVRWLFESLTNSDRRLLTYREARHNIIGDPFDLTDDVPFAAYEFLTEPVWRSDRLNAINQHFVTAFLDLHLKQKVELAPYLDVPTAVASLGSWPLAPGEMPGDTVASAAQPEYWRGFQRRWATGLELERLHP